MPLVKNTNPNPIAVARVAAGLTQVELAIKTQRSVATIRLAEAGIATATTRVRIATALGLPIASVDVAAPSVSPGGE